MVPGATHRLPSDQKSTSCGTVICGCLCRRGRGVWSDLGGNPVARGQIHAERQAKLREREEAQSERLRRQQRDVEGAAFEHRQRIVRWALPDPPPPSSPSPHRPPHCGLVVWYAASDLRWELQQP